MNTRLIPATSRACLACACVAAMLSSLSGQQPTFSTKRESVWVDVLVTGRELLAGQRAGRWLASADCARQGPEGGGEGAGGLCEMTFSRP
jgi:hypothetical protein